MISSNATSGSKSKNSSNSSKNNYITIPVITDYIRPNESYDSIINKAAELLEEDDYLVISETPIAISQGRLVDELAFKPSILSILLADVWSKYIWGYFLGPMFHIKSRTIKNLRRLPKEARCHKQLILEYYGIKHALKPASEAGVDLSNVPGSCVCLLPENPQKVVGDIYQKIKNNYKKDVTVMIIDTDVTYQLGGMKFTSIPLAMPGIKRDLGLFAYLLGRFGKIKGPTPLAVSKNEDIDTVIKIAKIAEDFQKKDDLSMETVYDMKNRFNKDITEVTIEMLESIEHKPAVIVREVI